MGYVDENLMGGESVLYKTSLHWAIYLKPAMMLAFSVVLLSLDGSQFFGMILIILSLILGIISMITRKTSEFGLTNKRVIIKTGFISRKTLETLLTKIEAISIDQSVLGRMMNFGTIIITGTGGGAEPFKGIRSPLEFRRKTQEQIDKL